jgi:hypothetical protein
MNFDFFTKTELNRKRADEVQHLCTERGIELGNNKKENMDKILAWQAEQNESDHDEQENGTEQGQGHLAEDNGANGAERRGTKRPAVDAGSSAAVGSSGSVDNQPKLLTTQQLEAVVSQMLNQQGSREVSSMRTELQSVMVRRNAERWFPDRVCKKAKHQHEYDTIRDIARTVYRLEHAATREEEQDCVKELRDMVIARGATIVTAEEMGWGVAKYVEPEKDTFMKEAKPIIKEARAKFRKSDITTGGFGRKSQGTSNAGSGFFLKGSGVRQQVRNSGGTPRLATPSGGRLGTNKPCWTCGGPHLKKDCPHNKSNNNKQ